MRSLRRASPEYISLKKIHYEPFKGRVLFHTTYSEYFTRTLPRSSRTVHMFDALDFLAELTQHIPPRGLQLIRRYGLYASRTKGRCTDMPYVAERAPAGWRASHPKAAPQPEEPDFEPLDNGQEVPLEDNKRAWARLLSKVYEVYPFLCPRCRSEMKVIAIIEDPQEIRRILRHLVKIGRSPPGLDPVSVN